LHMLFNALHHQVCCTVSSKPITRSHACIHRRNTIYSNKLLETNGIHHVLPSFSLFELFSAGQHFKHHLASRPPVPVRGHARAWWRHALAAVVGIIRSRRERFNFRTVISMYVLVYFFDAQPHISYHWHSKMRTYRASNPMYDFFLSPRCQNRRLYVSLYKRVLNSPGTKELKVADKEVLEVRQLAFSAIHREGSISIITLFLYL
jgi:hypothetical protein